MKQCTLFLRKGFFYLFFESSIFFSLFPISFKTCITFTWHFFNNKSNNLYNIKIPKFNLAKKHNIILCAHSSKPYNYTKKVEFENSKVFSIGNIWHFKLTDSLKINYHTSRLYKFIVSELDQRAMISLAGLFMNR